MQSAIYDAFYQVMMPQYGANAKECYQARFYSYGLFGLLDEWIKRGFKESVEEMVIFFYQIIKTNVHCRRPFLIAIQMDTCFGQVLLTCPKTPV